MFKGGVKRLFSLDRFIGGLLLGIANYGSLYFLIKTLNSMAFDSSVVFCIINTGIVFLNVCIGIFIFRERITLLNKIGIFFSANSDIDINSFVSIMANDLYKTIEEASTGIYKEKGSKFLAFAYPVATEYEVKDILDGLKKEYYDARHHCYAYVLGADKDKFRANDDGEPSSTGGKPILGQILSNDLTNIFIVVVRYFGGTKLGVSGLINAYRSAASDAINNAKIPGARL